MPASRRVLSFALVGLALVGLAVWLGRTRSGKDGKALSTIGGSRSAVYSAGETATLPKPGSAVDLDELLHFARRDLSAFTTWLAQHTAALGPEQKTAFLRELMRRWLAEWRAGAPGGIRDVFHRLADTAPETAGRLVDLLPSVPLRHILVEDLVASWAERDPDAAERWIVVLDEALDRSHGFTSLAEARLRRDAGAAMQWANAKLENPTNPAIVQDLTLGFAAADPARTAEWATLLPEGTLKNQATVTLATAWADTDAPKASQWAASLAQSTARDDAVTAVGQVWSSTDPVEATRWFGTQTFTSPDARFLAVRDFSEALTVADPEASQRWIDTLAEPEVADAALAGAADATYDDDPEKAALTALKMKDPVSRATTLGELMKSWREDEPEAAEKFAAKHLVSTKKSPAP